MQVQVQMKVLPPSVIYDSKSPDTPADSIQKKILKWLNPVVQVKEEGITLYKNKPFYPDQSGRYYALIGGGLGLAFIFSGLVVRAMSRR